MATTLLIPLSVEVDGYTIRELPEAEWGRLTTAPGSLHGQALTPSETARILVIEDAAGAIVGYWPLFAMMHADHLYLAPEVRQHPKLGLTLVGAVGYLLQRLGVGYVCAVIADADQPENGRLAEKLGLVPVPGRLYIGAVSAAADPAETREAS